MINYGANYIGVDRDRYDAGNKFYSQDRFLQGVGLDKPAITFNSSPNNAGIMGMYPKYPYPPIMSEDGGDGGGPIGPRGNSKFDYEFEALGGLYNPDNVPLTEEEQKTLNRQKNIDMLKSIGKFGLTTLSPFGPLTTMGIGKGIGFVKDKFFGGDGGEGFDQDQYDAGKASAAAQEAANRDYARSGGDDGGSSGGQSDSQAGADASQSASDEDAGAGGYAYGGRASFSNGGLSKYEIFKLGELGYNTKGGTVTAPFGGVKVLRDILKVNQYAGGGIVGLYR
jgi:hypothetical protein